jgi:alpha-tubulin suppressor-like RCC1 family protein
MTSSTLPDDDDDDVGCEDNQCLLFQPLPSPSVSIRHIAAGEKHMMACSSTGVAFSMGWNGMGACGLGRHIIESHEPVPLAPPFGGIVKISSVSAGMQQSLLLTEDGDVYLCGWNSDGQLGLGEGKSLHLGHTMAMVARLWWPGPVPGPSSFSLLICKNLRR